MAEPCTKGYKTDPKQGFMSKIPYEGFFVEMEISKCALHGHEVDICGCFVQEWYKSLPIVT
jgi:hypothetical protein